MANDRGKVVEIALIVKYPDGSIKTPRIDPSDIQSLVVDPDECQRLLGDRWTVLAGEWKDRPTCVLILKDGTALEYCQTTGHEPRPQWAAY